MPWVSLTLDVPIASADEAQALLHEAGAAGLEVRDSEVRPMPSSRAPAQGEAIVVAYFEQRTDALAAHEALTEALPGARGSIEDVVERDWSLEWRSRIRSVTVGRLWVGPPWEKDTAPKDKVRLFIEPKMAFGTGDHPTTALCLAAVDTYLGQHPGASVLDVGTGTGVLLFAAKKLGATRCVGLDNDPVAIEVAQECAVENGITGVELSTATLEALESPFDLVVANILANTLVDLAAPLTRHVGDRLVLSGILGDQADEVVQAYTRAGLTEAGRAVDGEWVRLDLERR